MLRARFVFGCLAAFVVTGLCDALEVRTVASAAWLENIGRASLPPNWLDAMRYEARGSAGQFREWGAGLLTAGDVEFGFEHVPKFTRLDALSGGLGGTVRQKFGLGALAPALAVDLGLRGRDAKMNGDDGWTATAGLRLTKRVNESWRLGATADWQQHYAKSSIFDTRHHRVFGTIAWDIKPWLQLSHGNGRLWGDFTANAGGAIWPVALAGGLGPDVARYYNTVSWGVTDSLGPGWVTYRVTGRVSFWWLELSPALGRNTSLPLRYERRLSVNTVGVKYRQDVWTLQAVHRF